MVVVELEFAPHRFEVGPAKRGADGCLILDLSVDGTYRRIDQLDRVITECGKSGWLPTVLGGERGDELLVRCVIEARMPIGPDDQANSGVALGRKCKGICGWILGVEWDLIFQPGLRVLLGKGDAACADMKGENCVRLFRPDTCNFCRKIELRERRIKGPDCLTLEIPHRRPDVLVTGLVVGTEKEHALQPPICHVLADGRGPIVARKGDNETIFLAFFARELERPGQRADREDPCVGEGLPDRHHGVGGGKAGDEIDPRFVDQLGCDLNSFRRIGLGVDDRHLDR